MTLCVTEKLKVCPKENHLYWIWAFSEIKFYFYEIKVELKSWFERVFFIITVWIKIKINQYGCTYAKISLNIKVEGSMKSPGQQFHMIFEKWRTWMIPWKWIRIFISGRMYGFLSARENFFSHYPGFWVFIETDVEFLNLTFHLAGVHEDVMIVK